MSEYTLYRKSTLGTCLVDSVDQLVQRGDIDSSTANSIMETFDRSISEKLHSLKNKITIKVWFILFYFVLCFFFFLFSFFFCFCFCFCFCVCFCFCFCVCCLLFVLFFVFFCFLFIFIFFMSFSFDLIHFFFLKHSGKFAHLQIL